MVRQLNKIISEVRVPLGPHYEVYDAEISGALAGLKAALASPSTYLATDVHVILDNQEAACRPLSEVPSRTSQDSNLEFRQLAAAWPAREIWACARPGQVRVLWSPGHIGIAGNVRADQLAGEAAALPAPPGASLAGARAWVERTVKDLTTSWWLDKAPPFYKELELNFIHGPPDELCLPRQHLSFLIQCRTRHGDFESHHTRLGHKDALLDCSCGARKTPVHLAYCKIARARRAGDGRDRALGSFDFLLGTVRGAKKLSSFLGKTNFLIDICPRKLPSSISKTGHQLFNCRPAPLFWSHILFSRSLKRSFLCSFHCGHSNRKCSTVSRSLPHGHFSLSMAPIRHR